MMRHVSGEAHNVSIAFALVNTADVEAVETHLDQVMTELCKLVDDKVTDPTIELDTESWRITLVLSVVGDSDIDRMATAASVIRTAIHAAGGATGSCARCGAPGGWSRRTAPNDA